MVICKVESCPYNEKLGTTDIRYCAHRLPSIDANGGCKYIQKGIHHQVEDWEKELITIIEDEQKEPT